LVVAKTHGGSHHFAMLEEIAHNICCRAI
jgi:hypothetical protein